MSLEIPMTKLEAVNAILRDAGARTTSSLTSPTRKDVIDAEDILDQVSRSVQLEGHWFNTEIISVSIDGSSQYVIAAAITHVERISGGPTNGTNGAPFLVLRSGLLYDTVNATNTFPAAAAVKLKVHRLLSYEALPSSAREYIYAAASIRNQSQMFGSRSIDQDLREQAKTARALIAEEDLDAIQFDSKLSNHFITMMHRR